MDGMDAISSVSGKQLTPDQRAEVAKLAARDRDVRAHEAAHLAAAGALATGVEYTYQLGPDGKLYAVGGNVKISVPGGLSAEQRLADARQLRAAANAPTDPSGQDMTVATQAGQMEADALQQLAQQRDGSAKSGSSGAGSPTHFRGLNRTA